MNAPAQFCLRIGFDFDGRRGFHAFSFVTDTFSRNAFGARTIYGCAIAVSFTAPNYIRGEGEREGGREREREAERLRGRGERDGLVPELNRPTEVVDW